MQAIFVFLTNNILFFKYLFILFETHLAKGFKNAPRAPILFVFDGIFCKFLKIDLHFYSSIIHSPRSKPAKVTTNTSNPNNAAIHATGYPLAAKALQIS
jgi:hypothetical protein